jgi:hypothetical protein
VFVFCPYSFSSEGGLGGEREREKEKGVVSGEKTPRGISHQDPLFLFKKKCVGVNCDGFSVPL